MLDAAGWIENAFADAFGLVEDVVLQPAMDATCNKSTHARSSVGRVRMFTTFFFNFSRQGAFELCASSLGARMECRNISTTWIWLNQISTSANHA
jgi:hypothetical protein